MCRRMASKSSGRPIGRCSNPPWGMCVSRDCALRPSGVAFRGAAQNSDLSREPCHGSEVVPSSGLGMAAPTTGVPRAQPARPVWKGKKSGLFITYMYGRISYIKRSYCTGTGAGTTGANHPPVLTGLTTGAPVLTSTGATVPGFIPSREIHIRSSSAHTVLVRVGQAALTSGRSSRRDRGRAHEKKGAPHLHVCLLPMQQPSHSGLSLANDGFGFCARARSPIACTARASCWI